MKIEDMIEEFQCPGCVGGSDTSCGRYEYNESELRCVSHVLGTHIGFGNIVALGLPKGFNKPGHDIEGKAMSKMRIRLYLKGDSPLWDKLNVPIWAMEKDGFLFVRTYLPRLNVGYVDVLEGGTLSMVPEALNVNTILPGID